MCEHCENGEPLFVGEHGAVRRVEIDNDLIVITCEYDEDCTAEKSFYIEFCPKCGRCLDGSRYYRRPTCHDGKK